MIEIIPAGWYRIDEKSIGTGSRRIDLGDMGYVAHYKNGNGSSSYSAQAWRGGNVVSAPADSLDEALRFTTDHLEIPIEEFNRIVADGLVKEIAERQQRLIDIGCADLITGFDAGYARGRTAAFDSIRIALLDVMVDEEAA